MLISLWTGRKPTLRTHEMVCYYLMGWADEETLTAHITKLQQHDAAKKRWPRLRGSLRERRPCRFLLRTSPPFFFTQCEPTIEKLCR